MGQPGHRAGLDTCPSFIFGRNGLPGCLQNQQLNSASRHQDASPGPLGRFRNKLETEGRKGRRTPPCSRHSDLKNRRFLHDIRKLRGRNNTKRPINVNNFPGLSRDGGGVKFVYVLPFSWQRETHEQNLPGNLMNFHGTIKISPPPPTPEFLSRDFPSAARSQTKTLTDHSLSKGNQVSLVRTFLSEPGSGSKIGRLGGWGWKIHWGCPNDPWP